MLMRLAPLWTAASLREVGKPLLAFQINTP
jgi:hypothetical protein